MISKYYQPFIRAVLKTNHRVYVETGINIALKEPFTKANRLDDFKWLINYLEEEQSDLVPIEGDTTQWAGAVRILQELGFIITTFKPNKTDDTTESIKEVLPS